MQQSRREGWGLVSGSHSRDVNKGRGQVLRQKFGLDVMKSGF